MTNETMDGASESSNVNARSLVPSITAAGTPSAQPQRRLYGRLVGRFGTLIGLAAMLAYFAVKSDVFLTRQNLLNVLSASALLGIVASGLTLTLVLFEFDLSIGWVATAAGMFAAGVAVDHGTVVGFGVGLLVGLVVGLANGLIVTYLNVHALIATLAMGTVLQGVIFGYRSGAQISGGLPESFSSVGRNEFGGVRMTVWIMLAVMALLWTMLGQTPLGRRMYAVGGNATAARLSGINIRRIRILAFILCALLAALAGVLLASNLNAGNPTAGLGFLLEAFTACFIGAATLRDGEFHIGGTLVGVLILGVLANGLVLTGVSASWQTIIRGVVLIVAVAISGLMRRSAEA